MSYNDGSCNQWIWSIRHYPSLWYSVNVTAYHLLLHDVALSRDTSITRIALHTNTTCTSPFTCSGYALPDLPTVTHTSTCSLVVPFEYSYTMSKYNKVLKIAWTYAYIVYMIICFFIYENLQMSKLFSWGSTVTPCCVAWKAVKIFILKADVWTWSCTRTNAGCVTNLVSSGVCSSL